MFITDNYIKKSFIQSQKVVLPSATLLETTPGSIGNTTCHGSQHLYPAHIAYNNPGYKTEMVPNGCFGKPTNKTNLIVVLQIN